MWSDRLRGCGVCPSNFLESILLYQDGVSAVKQVLNSLQTEQHHCIIKINWTVNLQQ